MNTFFSNIVTNLKVPEYTDYDPLANSKSVSIFKLIARHRNHFAYSLYSLCSKSQKFFFSFSVSEKDTENKNKNARKKKLATDKGNLFGVLLIDFSKAFDCLSHHLLLAKLHACSLSALKLIHSYLENKKQRNEIDSTYSSWWEKILFRAPQGSIVGSLLFNFSE